MNKHYTYLLIDLLTILFPLLLSFDKKVAFYKNYKYLWRGMLPTGIFFIIWDILFTKNNIWSFNNDYVTGLYIANLPIEEWLFFIVVPYACSFVYSCLSAYIPFRTGKSPSWTILIVSGAMLVVLSIIFTGRTYTFYSFWLCGISIILVYILRDKLSSFRANIFIYTVLVCQVPFLIVNGLLTSIPVVIYNYREHLNLLIYTIPSEDIFYGTLLMLGSIISLPTSAKKETEIPTDHLGKQN